MNSLGDIWKSILSMLDNIMSPTALKTWFDDSVPVDIKGDKFVLYTPSDFKRGIIEQRYSDKICSALTELFSAEFQLVILAGEDELNAYNDEKNMEQGNDIPELAGYTFENFVVGPSNKYAHAAAMAVSDKPGTVYNPLFIYGNSGLGKTHLLRAIGQKIHQNNPVMNIVYVKGDSFINELVKSIREGKTEEFRNKYRNADLLLMDDIQFIAGKVQTEEEFFHTFNALYDEEKQIVVTSDRPPMEMNKLADRIRTRLECGLMADVQPPDEETRMAIIRSKSTHLGMVLSDEIVEFVATTITSNIRQLEGVVNRLAAYRDLLNSEITLDAARRAIKDVIHSGPYIPTPEIIIEETSRYYGITADEIKGQSRKKNIVNARQTAMYLCRTITSLPLSDIGNEFNRDHTTVLSSVCKVENSMKNDKETVSAVRDITSNINSKN